MGKNNGGREAPYEQELASMFAAQNMMNMASRNPNAATLFRPGTDLGDSYNKLFGTFKLPTQQKFTLPDIGIASDATRRVYGNANTPREYGKSIMSVGSPNTQYGFTREPVFLEQAQSNNPITSPNKYQPSMDRVPWRPDPRGWNR